MKVFVLQGHWDWEGFEIIGIFRSKELAETAMAALPRGDGKRMRYDECEITEHEVQE